MAEVMEIKVRADTGPLDLYLKLLKAVSEVPQLRFLLGDFPSELVRIENNPDTAGTGELGIVLYPSDALLHFASALGAGDFDFYIVEKAAHDSPPVSGER